MYCDVVIQPHFNFFDEIIKVILNITYPGPLLCFRQYQPEHRQIVIDFETIEKNMKSDSVGPASTNQRADSDLANQMLQMDVSAAATSFIHA